MAAHGYNDLHKHFGVITHHESQSPGAQKIQKSLRKLYPETNSVFYNHKTGKSYPISNLRPFIDQLGNSNQPTSLATHAFNTDLSVSTENQSPEGRERIRSNRLLRNQ